ncbi:MAG: beta strand repeat-containing protein [Inquilinus sp.]|uniref:beta strand repeat-containing protein n=1 Tax=Inquilinus sp. TaxID=1932117 RepID=UPI003F393879
MAIIINGTAGNDILTGFNPGDPANPDGIETINGFDGDDTLRGLGGGDTLDGGAGIDTIRYDGSVTPVVVDLGTGQGTSGDAQGDVLLNIENVIGTIATDFLTGNGATNTLSGSAGNDTLAGAGGADTLFGGSDDDSLSGGAGADDLQGGGGVDTVTYLGGGAGVQVDLQSGTGTGGDAQGDILTDIENLHGSGSDDVLRGDGGANVLNGDFGNDILIGRGGADVLNGSGSLSDTASYAGSAAVQVSLASGTGTGGDAQGDTFNEIENLAGSSFNDQLRGDGDANGLSGADGDDTLIGAAGADALDGGAGVDAADYGFALAGVSVDLGTGSGSGGEAAGDTLTAIENLIGSAFDDTLGGDAGANGLSGGEGNDTLHGAGGADQIDGGNGTDVADYEDSAAGVTVNLAAGTGAGGDAAGDTLTGIEFVIGSAFDDTLTGDAAANDLQGGGGNDTIRGGAGADNIDGGIVNFVDVDTVDYSTSAAGVTVEFDVSGGTGSGGDAEGDTLDDIEAVIGSAFADRLINNFSEMWLQGGDGNDTIVAGGSADHVDGGAGVDTADYSTSLFDGVTVDLGAGTGPLEDTLVSIENLIGTDFDDALYGSAGANALTGGGGADVLRGGGGGDQLDGGAGTDTASYYTGAAGVTVDLAAGTGTGGDAQGDTLAGIENLTGSNQGNDTLLGNAGANTLSGWGGSDVLRGGAGADRLDGGAGTDTATYYTGAAGVTVDLAAGTGTGGEAQGDTLVGIENLTGSNLGNDTLLGNAGANILSGWGGGDVLRGGAGADRLDGGAGTDAASYYTSAAGVTVDLAAGSGTGGDAQGDILIGIENLTGSNLANDTLIGNAGANTLAGWGGSDVLRGGAGADALDGGAGTDTASYYTSGTGILVSLASGLGSGGEAQGDTLTGIENVSGSQGGDSLYGNTGANVLQGWNGNDILVGRAGQDTLTGGAGADRFVYVATAESVVGANADRITDFSHAQGDRIELSGIDANTGVAGDQAFTFIGSGLFTGVAGQLRAVNSSPGVVTIAGDVNGDGASDFHIQLTGTLVLVAGDFVL